MPWLQIILDTNAQTVEQISESLIAVGALSVTWQDADNQPLYEPPLNTTPLWKKTRIIGLFEDQLPTQLQATLAPLLLPPYQIQKLEDQEWSRICMADFHPMSFGKRLWICPSWETPPDPQAVNIRLDPGLAFGTGTHATTALCLKWLDQQTDWSGKTLIDYGCGSGILAIAAAKLGAAQIWAVDNDPQALLATQENANHNEVEALINPVLPDQLPSNLKADYLLANILAAPLISLAPTFATHLNTNALLILSGILPEQTDEVTAAYTPDFAIIEIIECDNWMRIVAKKI